MNVWLPLVSTLSGDLAHNPGMCPDWESNQRLFVLQSCAQSTEPHQLGHHCFFREKGRDKRDREKHRGERETLIGCLPYAPQLGILPAAQVCAVTRNLTCNLSVYTDDSVYTGDQWRHTGQGWHRFSFLKKIIYLFVKRGERRKEVERNINQLPLICALTRNQTEPRNPGTCPGNRTGDLCVMMPNQLSHTSVISTSYLAFLSLSFLCNTGRGSINIYLRVVTIK